MLLSKIIQESQSFSSKVADFQVVALFLKLIDYNDWKNYFVFRESE
jgi:hypothetical protein